MIRPPTHRRNAVVANVRWAVHRYALAFTIIAAVAVVSVAQNHQAELAKARAHVTDAVLPIAGVVNAPLDAIHTVMAGVRDISHVYSENEVLNRQNIALRQWQQQAQLLETENERLRKLLKVATGAKADALTAPVISESGGAYQQSMLALAGVDDGVEVGSVAMGPSGVIGRVIEVGSRAARILLLSDENSRVPVQLEQTGERAIAAGTGSGDMVLNYLPTDVVPQPGERVLTSGHGGVFPDGLVVGEVVFKNGRFVVAPVERLSAQHWVRIIDYRAATDTAKP